MAAAILVAGCYVRGSQGPTPRYFQLELPPVGSAAAVPGQVSDTTATISRVEVDVRIPPIGGLDETFVGPVAGQPNALVVGWVGGTCDARVDLDLSLGGDGRPTFTLKRLDRPGGCDLVGVPRRLILTFDALVSAEGYRLELVR